MNIKQWLGINTCPNTRASVAKEARTSVGYLWQLAGGHRGCGRDMAERLSKATNNEITVVHAMMPDMSEPIVSDGFKESV